MTTPSLSIHRETASSRTFTRWTPALIEAAQVMADGGSLRLAADLCEALLGDGRVSGVLSTRVLGLFGLPLGFEKANLTDRDEIAKALEDDFWKAFPESELAQLVSWGLLLGIGLGELAWEESANGRFVPELRVWHPRHLRWDWNTRQWILTTDDAGEIPIAPGDGKWVLYTPYGTNRPWAHGKWRACAPWWLSKVFALQDWAGFSEVHGSPVKAATAPAGAKTEDREAAADQLDAMGGGGSIALPPGWDMKLVEAMSTAWQTFPGVIDKANVEISISLVGQNLTSEVTAGSFAAASVHKNVHNDLIKADERTVSTTLHEQALTFWAEWNYGDPSLAPWPHWDTEPPEDTKAVGDGLQSIAQAITAIQSLGVTVDVKAMLKAKNVPLLEDQQPAAPAPAEDAAPENQ